MHFGIFKQVQEFILTIPAGSVETTCHIKQAPRHQNDISDRSVWAGNLSASPIGYYFSDTHTHTHTHTRSWGQNQLAEFRRRRLSPVSVKKMSLNLSCVWVCICVLWPLESTLQSAGRASWIKFDFILHAEESQRGITETGAMRYFSWKMGCLAVVFHPSSHSAAAFGLICSWQSGESVNIPETKPSSWLSLYLCIFFPP